MLSYLQTMDLKDSLKAMALPDRSERLDRLKAMLHVEMVTHHDLMNSNLLLTDIPLPI
jgi:tRNA A-37 threonylcarbamoyl transferase component Bud32